MVLCYRPPDQHKILNEIKEVTESTEIIKMDDDKDPQRADQISQQDKFKEKILNTLNERVLEQLLCPMISKQRFFLYLSPFCLMLQKMERKNA